MNWVSGLLIRYWLRAVHGVLLCSCLHLGALAQEEAATRRLALLIGNEAYGTQGLASLSHPHEDVDRVAAALEAAGFRREDIVVLKDAGRDATIAAFNRLAERIREPGAPGMAFVYYSGHGGSEAKVGGSDSYLVPVASPIAYAEDLVDSGVSIPAQLSKMRANPAVSIIVVTDACRNFLPRRDKRGGVNKGIGRQDFGDAVPAGEGALAGWILLSAAADGEFADDSPVFSTILSEEIRRDGQNVLAAFDTVARRVAEANGSEQQRPMLVPSLNDPNVCFRTCPAELPDLDRRDCEQARDVQSPHLWRTYLRNHPDGECRAEAGREILRLAGVQTRPDSYIVITSADRPIDPTLNDTPDEARPFTVVAVNGQPLREGQAVEIGSGHSVRSQASELRFVAGGQAGDVQFSYTVADAGGARADGLVKVSVVQPVFSGSLPADAVPVSLGGAPFSVSQSEVVGQNRDVTIEVSVGLDGTLRASFRFSNGRRGSGTAKFKSAVHFLDEYYAPVRSLLATKDFGGAEFPLFETQVEKSVRTASLTPDELSAVRYVVFDFD